MQKAIYLFLICLFSHRFLVDNNIIPNSAKWIIDLFAIFTVPIIFICLAINKKFNARPIYLILIILLFIIVLFGSILNNSSASAMILGIRHHFKYLPLFILPMVYDFNDHQIKKILLLLCGLCILQLPVTIYQRFFQYSYLETGDIVAGTVGGSGVVSIILICAICVLYSLFLKKYINNKKLWLISACLFLPTTINETKITFFILPMGLTISTFLFGDKNILRKLKRIAGYCFITIIFTAFFVFMYNNMYGGNSKTNLLERLYMEKEGRGYIYLGEERAKERIEAGIHVGRVDAIVIAFRNISKDYGQLFFGIGIGNALYSNISFLKIKNKDIRKYYPDITTIANIIWEMGLLGLTVTFILFFYLFKDALAMRLQDNYTGAFCLGWCSVVCIMVIALFYQNVNYTETLNITFWLLSGIMVSKKKDDSTLKLLKNDK